MKISTLTINEVSPQMVDLISRLVDLIPWPVRRQAMGDVTLSLLDGKLLGLEIVRTLGNVSLDHPFCRRTSYTA